MVRRVHRIIVVAVVVLLAWGLHTADAKYRYGQYTTGKEAGFFIFGEGISAADQQAIKDSGSQVELLSGDAYDIETQLNARIQAGRAFGG